ncbi:uncharacterized protein DUF955 [Dyadobacter jejuensis]|uniref:Uncharacterized protein DUF955 n=1 Tax=Dyadobacter jejuensis TaxID=1082580 RepID=A0A316A571_9BACT|nr:ImmA/IrrE family metallo-endopeptidase [Dyadobacter jejuensis]PWJ52622.1 uncharacterized protein DUF955 [Dyadobacter jejuensis]
MKNKHSELAKKKASRFRQKFGYSSNDPFPVDSFLIKEGIITTFTEMSENFSGMALKKEGNLGLIINSAQPIGRQNFSIAHELYHLYEQEDFVPRPSTAGKFDKKDIEEFMADKFAVYLLMPESGIMEMISEGEIESGKIEIGQIFKISGYFRVSFEATLNRLRDLEFINSDYKRELDELKSKSGGVKNMARLHGGDLSLYEKGRSGILLSNNMIELSDILFKNHIISEISYLSTMDRLGMNLTENDI